MKLTRINKPGIYDFSIELNETNPEEELQIVIKAYDPGDYKITVLTDHLTKNTFGRVQVKGVVRNGAKVNIKGLVKIEEKASRSDSFLSMRMLILDDKSSAIAEPMLEIKNNDVKASHSASVGKIDEEQLLYLQSRGIDLEESKEIIIRGFLGEDGDGDIVTN